MSHGKRPMDRPDDSSCANTKVARHCFLDSRQTNEPYFLDNHRKRPAGRPGDSVRTQNENCRGSQSLALFVLVLQGDESLCSKWDREGSEHHRTNGIYQNEYHRYVDKLTPWPNKTSVNVGYQNIMELTTAIIDPSLTSRRRRRRRRSSSSRTMIMIMTCHRRNHHQHKKSLLAAILSAAATILILYVLLLPRQARGEEYSVPSQRIFFDDEGRLPVTVDFFLKAAYKEVSTTKSAIRRSLDPSSVLAWLRINGDNQVLSRVGLNIEASDDIRSDIEAVGGSVVACGPFACTCWIPIAAIANVSELPSVKFMRAEMAGLRQHQGKIQNEAVRAHYVEALFDVALTGARLKIGVLSDSYDTNTVASTRAADDVSSGILPDDVTVLRDATNGSDGGRAILKLIHDIAPEAKLYFRTGFLGALDFADGIIELAKAGCNVIVGTWDFRN
jgi:hypothetical protein